MDLKENEPHKSKRLRTKENAALNGDRLEAGTFRPSQFLCTELLREVTRHMSSCVGRLWSTGVCSGGRCALPEEETRVAGPGRSARRGRNCAHLLHLRDTRPHWEQAPRRLQPVPTPTSCPHHAAASVSDASFSHIPSTVGPVGSAFQPLLTCGQPHTVRHPSSRLGSHSGRLSGQWPCCHSCPSLQPSTLSIQECTAKMSMSLPFQNLCQTQNPPPSTARHPSSSPASSFCDL